jgi:hypothetical protein
MGTSHSGTGRSAYIFAFPAPGASVELGVKKSLHLWSKE